MKKIIGCIVFAFLFSSLAVAQKIPVGREISAVVFDFARDKDSWTDASLVKVDPASDEYVVGGFAVQKNIVGYIKQSYSVAISKEDDELNVSVSDMNSIACDKNGNELKNANPIKNPKSTETKLAGLIKSDLAKRISTWSDEEYEQKLLKASSDPEFVYKLTKTVSNLYAKKFFEKNVNGKTVELEVLLKSIEENVNPITKQPEELQYKAMGSVEIKDGVNVLGLPNKRQYSIFIYSNNDKLLSAKIGSSYKSKGIVTIKDLSVGLDSVWIYQIDEK